MPDSPIDQANADLDLIRQQLRAMATILGAIGDVYRQHIECAEAAKEAKAQRKAQRARTNPDNSAERLAEWEDSQSVRVVKAAIKENEAAIAWADRVLERDAKSRNRRRKRS